MYIYVIYIYIYTLSVYIYINVYIIYLHIICIYIYIQNYVMYTQHYASHKQPPCGATSCLQAASALELGSTEAPVARADLISQLPEARWSISVSHDEICSR